MYVCYQDYAYTTGQIFMNKHEKMGLGPTWISLNFESDQGPISQRDLSPDLGLNLRLWS